MYMYTRMSRNNVGDFNPEKFKQVLHYIISKTEAHTNVGKKVLFKLLYFTDFNYYELYETKLTGETYAKLPHGPAPRNFNTIIAELIASGIIEEKTVKYFNRNQTKYSSLKEPKLTLLTAVELHHIDDTLCRYSSMNGSQIEALSHKDIVWISSELQDNLNYEMVFYRSPEMSVREYCDDRDDTD